MLKITKGLRPFVGDGIMIYTDEYDNKYVRVKMDGEDFYIASHDYIEGDIEEFLWDTAMKLLEAGGLTTFTKEQAVLYKEHLTEINKKFEEIGGDKLENYWYWTSTECNEDNHHRIWYYDGHNGLLKSQDSTIIRRSDSIMCRIRPIINLQ